MASLIPSAHYWDESMEMMRAHRSGCSTVLEISTVAHLEYSMAWKTLSALRSDCSMEMMKERH